MSDKPKLNIQLRLTAIAIGRQIAKLDPDAVEQVMLFLLKVAKAIIKATPDKKDDTLLALLEHPWVAIADAIGDLDGDD